MNGGVPLRPKFVCGPETKCSATRLPISLGDVPAGHLLNSFTSALSGNATAVTSTASNDVKQGRNLLILSLRS